MSAAPRLMASYFTLAGNVKPLDGDTVSRHTLADRAKAAAAAGYVGIGLSIGDLRHLVTQHGHDGIRGIVRDAGLQHIEIEVLLDWFADGERRAASDAERSWVLDTAERLGAYQVKVGGDITGGTWPVERMAESFGELARQAGDAGTMVTLEVFPASNVRDLPTAIAVAKGADPAHGGLLLDIWHMYRGNIPYAEIATVPPEYIRHIELDDGSAELVGSIMEDTLLRRKVPGEGEFGVPSFLRAIAATGYSGLYGVEILSDEFRSLGPREAAERSFRATMGEFAKLDRAA